jgi:hypothetical protein
VRVRVCLLCALREKLFECVRFAGSAPQRLICRIPGSGQAQCTSRRDFAPFSSSTHRAFHGEHAGKSDGGGLAGGCEARSARTRHNTNCIKEGNIKTSARLLPLESPARRCSGSKCFCAPGFAVQGRSSRAPSPASPQH